MNAISHFQRKIRRRLWRERRRMLVCAALMVLTQYVLCLALAPELLWSAVPALRALIAALAIGLLIVVVALVLPAMRFVAEVFCVLALGATCVTFIDPSFRFSIWYLTAQPRALVWVLVALALLALAYEGQLFRFPLMRAPKGRFAGVSRLTAPVLWDGLAGTPPHLDRLADRDIIVAFEALEPGAPHRRFVSRFGDRGIIEEYQFVEICDPPHHLRFRWQALNAAPNTGHDTGIYDLRIIDTGRKRRVTGASSARAFPANFVLRGWLDDHFGRELDRKLELLERRADGAPAALAVAAPG